jgi:hypothetical protein
MKKILFMVCLMIFSLSASTAVSTKSNPKKTSDNPITVIKLTDKLSENQVSLMTKRVEAIRDMDKTNLTVTEKRELRNELKAIKKDLRKDGGVIYIGAGTLLLIIILLIILL